MNDFWAHYYANSVAERVQDLYREREQWSMGGSREWVYHLGSRQRSDARGRDRVWADAHFEHAERLELLGQWPSARVQSLLDEEEAQRRYDNADQGGEHEWTA